MRFGKLYWLSLLSLLGLLQFPLHQSLFGVFFGFLGFIEFYKADERDQANLAKAGLTTFVVAMLGIAAVFVYVIVLRQSGSDVTQMGRQMVIGLVVLYTAVLLTFAGSSWYFDHQGE